MELAVDWAKKALAADESNAEANKWFAAFFKISFKKFCIYLKIHFPYRFAISLGATSCYVSVSEKIRNGVLFKEYIDKAIQINPSDYLLHHLLGRFSFEASIRKTLPYSAFKN